VLIFLINLLYQIIHIIMKYFNLIKSSLAVITNITYIFLLLYVYINNEYINK